MKESDIKERTEKYKQEMLEMFRSRGESADVQKDGRALTAPTDTNEKNAGSDGAGEKNNSLDSKTQKTDNNENANAAENAETSDDGEDDDIEKRYPPPVIPDFIKAGSKPQRRDAFGYLKVRVNTGSGGLPIAGNSVIVSEMINGEEELVKMLMTDTSGETETLTLPTYKNPDGIEPQDYTDAAEYNVSVVSEGYFSELSRNVSVFDGITSVQSFSLIPEPFDYTTDDTVVFDNPEPPKQTL